MGFLKQLFGISCAIRSHFWVGDAASWSQTKLVLKAGLPIIGSVHAELLCFESQFFAFDHTQLLFKYFLDVDEYIQWFVVELVLSIQNETLFFDFLVFRPQIF